jgi:hypothetical protein
MTNSRALSPTAIWWVHCLRGSAHQAIRRASSIPQKGIGRQLFYEVQKSGNAIVSLTNIDAANKGTNVFLLEIGLVQIVQQLEMGMKIN